MKLIHAAKLFLYSWGIWPVETIQSDLGRKLYVAYRVFIIGSYTILNISQTVECTRLIIHNEPFERISKCMSILVTMILALGKAVIYLKNGIPQLCLKVEEAEDALRKLEDEEIQSTYHKMIASNTFVNICNVGCTGFAVISFMVMSLVDTITVGPESWEFDCAHFMLELYLFFDKQKYCHFNLIINIYMGITSVLLNSAIQTTFFGLIMYASLRFKILSVSLQKIHEIPSSSNSDITAIFKGFLKEHQDSIRFVEQLNDTTKNVLLASFLLNSIKVASVLCQVLAVTDPVGLIFPVFYLSMLTSEVYFLGWLCNEIKEQSLAVADAAYNIFWYNENKDIKQMMQIMMMRAQKPSIMSIGTFGEMTTDTIVTTLKAAYSYATLAMNTK